MEFVRPDNLAGLMPTYAIGDLQGCYEELQELLSEINFDPAGDRLWFTGDLVNRGPDSLACLRFVKGLGEGAITVLGNHDLHLLALGYGCHERSSDTASLNEILSAPEREQLCDWLRRLPLAHHDKQLGFTLLHAGLPPHWDLDEAMARAAEVEQVLRGPDFRGFLSAMYGDEPALWSAELRGQERLRFITNCFTRIRCCAADGRLNLSAKGRPEDASGLPWFKLAARKSREEKIVFGHWAALRDCPDDYASFNVFPLDMGCVWGGALRAMRLEDQNFFSVPCRRARHTAGAAA